MGGTGCTGLNAKCSWAGNYMDMEDIEKRYEKAKTRFNTRPSRFPALATSFDPVYAGVSIS